MASTGATIRLRKDYIHIKRSPVPYALAEPDPQNILHWHYIITGPPDTPYENGMYHGIFKFPKDYPFKPPSILMYTPSGRFVTNMRICLSLSDYHPESWNPSWNVSSILTALVSFMVSDENTLGTMKESYENRRNFANDSFDWNTKINVKSTAGRKFTLLFEDFIQKECEKRAKLIPKVAETETLKVSSGVRQRATTAQSTEENNPEPKLPLKSKSKTATSTTLNENNQVRQNNPVQDLQESEFFKELFRTVTEGISDNSGSLAMFMFVFLFGLIVHYILSTVE